LDKKNGLTETHSTHKGARTVCGTPITVEKPVGKSEYVWEDNIKTNVRETLYENVEWIKLSPD